MRSSWGLLAAWPIVLAVVACDGGEGGSDPTPQEDMAVPAEDSAVPPAPDAGPEMPPDAGPPPVAFPDVWGPAPLEDLNPSPDVVEVEIRATEVDVVIDENLTLPMVAYNGQFPGPLLTAKVGDEIIVHFTNEMTQSTTIHWHGLRISDQMDGNPRIQDPVPGGGTFTYRFVAPEAGSFWYHPHVDANRQVEGGLYAPIVIRDHHDPAYDLERSIMLDDILVDPDRQDFVPFLSSHPEVMHGRHGNILLTNGRPSERVRSEATQGQVERWRLVNPANARTQELSLRGASFRVIGTDGGLLRDPYVTERLVISPGQRFDLEVSYDGPGPVELISHVLALDENDEVVTLEVPVFAVDVTASDAVPRTVPWPELPGLPEREVGNEVELVLDAVSDPATGIRWMINGEAHRHEPLFTFAEGETVRMRIVNRLGPEHPFHLHGQFFAIVGADGALLPGLRDTVLVPGLETVEIVAYLDNPGHWMAHCHILEHAELGMMTEIAVEPSP
ncbi:MAG: multicopper oxidase family protein [Deltaproteobacteria bacterium]|nr:multicopper oxidase family protein [Deltaproteobacteria bacterium]